MTISEFNAWLDGLDVAIDGAPTREQWRNIRAKFSEVVRDEKWQLHFVPAQPLAPPAISQPWMTTWRANTCGSA